MCCKPRIPKEKETVKKEYPNEKEKQKANIQNVLDQYRTFYLLEDYLRSPLSLSMQVPRNFFFSLFIVVLCQSNFWNSFLARSAVAPVYYKTIGFLPLSSSQQIHSTKVWQYFVSICSGIVFLIERGRAPGGHGKEVDKDYQQCGTDNREPDNTSIFLGIKRKDVCALATKTIWEYTTCLQASGSLWERNRHIGRSK